MMAFLKLDADVLAFTTLKIVEIGKNTTSDYEFLGSDLNGNSYVDFVSVAV
jgi:hypothetical protein